MSLWRSDPIRAADALIVGARSELELVPASRLLLVNQGGTLPESLRGEGYSVTVWNRRMAAAYGASSAPPDGSFDTAMMRIPKSKDELVMQAHQAFATVRDGGRLIVYGGNDEGIKTVGKRLDELALPIEIVSTRGHGRVLALTRSGSMPIIRSALVDWRQAVAMTVNREPTRRWATYPGLFAGGALDPGTALLLTELPVLKAGAAVLDFGCGTGPIAASLLERDPRVQVDMLDNDAIALIAAAENAPRARPILGRDLSAVSAVRYDLIVSNPPIHDGIREDHRALEALITAAPTCLEPGGGLLLVAQRRIPLQTRLSLAFAHVSTLADDGRFRIWFAHN